VRPRHAAYRRASAWRPAAGLLAALAGVLAWAPAGPAPAGAPTPPPIRSAAIPALSPGIEIRNFSFATPALTVPAGTTVTWTNRDEEPHTVTSAERVFASPGLDAGETFSFTFTTPGTYHYYCALHPHMTGTVVVR
jgi:amicyanin